jgi:hypothetical protein
MRWSSRSLGIVAVIVAALSAAPLALATFTSAADAGTLQVATGSVGAVTNVTPIVDCDKNSSMSVTVTWPAASNATAYTVYRATSASGPYTSLTVTDSTSVTDTAVASQRSYWYVATPARGGWSGSTSPAAATTTPKKNCK